MSMHRINTLYIYKRSSPTPETHIHTQHDGQVNDRNQRDMNKYNYQSSSLVMVNGSNTGFGTMSGLITRIGHGAV